MAQSQKRLFVLLSLCLLLQQFSPVFSGNLSRTRISDGDEERQDYAEEKEDNDDQECSDRASRNLIGNLFKKGVKKLGTKLKSGWKLIGEDAFIKKVETFSQASSLAASVTSLGFSIDQGINGCTRLVPELPQIWKDYKDKVAKFDSLTKHIFGIKNQAYSLQLYINESFYEYRRTRDKLEEIADERERVFESLGPEVIDLVKNQTSKIKTLLTNANKTGKKVNETKIFLGYLSKVDLGMKIFWDSMGVVMAGGQLLWDRYIKDTIFGKKLIELKCKFKKVIFGESSKVEAPDGTNKNKKGRLGRLSSRIRASKIMNTRFGRGLQAIGNSIKKGLAKVAKVFGSIIRRVTPWLGVANSAFQVWNIFKQYKKCQETAKKSKESLANMTLLIANNTEILNEVKESYRLMQLEFNKTKSYAFQEPILDAMTRLKDMMLNSEVVQQTEANAKIASSLQAYIDGKNSNSKQQINKLQRDANSALHSIPFTLRCFTTRGKFIHYVKENCKKGKNSLSNIYTDEKGRYTDEEKKCTEKTKGKLLPSLQKLKTSWQKWVASPLNSKGCNKVCLMNDKATVNVVREKLQNGQTDPQTIANEVGKSNSLDEIQEMIAILSKDPSIKALPEDVQTKICDFKTNPVYSEYNIDTKLLFLNSSMGPRKVTKQEFENQICPPPKSRDIVSS